MKRFAGLSVLATVLLVAGCGGKKDEVVKSGDRLSIFADGAPHDVIVGPDGRVDLGPLGIYDAVGRQFSDVAREISDHVKVTPMPEYDIHFFGVADRPIGTPLDHFQPGDIALVDISGTDVEAEVSPTGDITLPEIGTLNVGELNFGDATKRVIDAWHRAYPDKPADSDPKVLVRLAGVAPRVPGYPYDRFVGKDRVHLKIGEVEIDVEVKPATGMIAVPGGVGPVRIANQTAAGAIQRIQNAWRQRKVGSFIDRVDVVRPGEKLIVNFDNKVSTLTVASDGMLTVPGVDPVPADMKTTDEIVGAISAAWAAKQTQPVFQIRGQLDNEGKIVPDSDVQYTVDGETFVVPLADDSNGGFYNGFYKVGEVRIAGHTIDEAQNAIADAWKSQLSVHVFVEKPSGYIKHGWSFWLAVGGILVGMFVLFFGLTKVHSRIRRLVVATCVFVTGAFWVFEFFLPTAQEGPKQGQNFLTEYITSVAAPASNVVSGVLLGLGVYSLLRVHGGRVVKRQKDWSFSLILLLIIPVMAGVMLVYYGPDNAYTLKPFWHDTRNVVFERGYASMDAAMFSMIAFFIMSAAYRAFRLRSIEASILMLTALIVLLGLLPIGALITSKLPIEGFASSLRIENVAQWFLLTISTPALRAIEFGIGVGVLAMSLRIWLNLERGALFD